MSYRKRDSAFDSIIGVVLVELLVISKEQKVIGSRAW